MSQIKFQKLINDFSPESLVEIFKSHDFFRIKQNLLTPFDDKQFISFIQLGYFDLEDNANIVVICARSLTPLNERAGRKKQYDISKKILKNFQKSRAGIFIYYDSKGDFRVSLIYADYVGIKVNYSTFRRFTYFVSKELTNTTFFQQLASLDFKNFQELKEIFSVEKVTKEFFKKYRDLFIELLEDFEQNKEFKNTVLDTNISTTPDFVKKLMGQIVFLYFVQKKGWLGVRPNENWGTGNQTFLRFLFETCIKSNKNYFNDYLEPLFYKALAEKRGNDDYFEELNCRIPFLNGGLFESIYDWENTEINIHNKTLGKLLDFFDQYNFTVDENTPSDQEISIDPEMLGKIFENLLEVKDRKDKGAFYTPREIVHYMCRESLIQHLVSETSVPEERIRKIFEIKDTDLSVLVEDERKTEIIKRMQELKDIAEKVDLSLRNIKIVDPAVGSGAFPMGMLNEISSVRYYLNINFLHLKNKEGKELTLYDIKKETLENCIYAVDLEPGAVEIAKLRFWLALIVEYESNDANIAPPTLPNLDYKIMQGNSLLEEYEGVKLFDEKLLKQPLINAEIFTQENQLISKLQGELMSFYMKTPEWMQKGEHKNKPEEVKNLENKIRDLLKQKKKINQDSVDQKDLFTSSTGDSKLIWDEIKSKHERFFSESNREKKKDLRKQIDHLNWLLIESTLEEQKNDSALEKLKELKKSNIKPFFLWHLYFADVFEEKGGFDIVIGNPPYISVRTKNFKKEWKDLFKNKYLLAVGQYDMYVLFIELANIILKDQGTLSYIIPKRMLSNESFETTRNYILEKIPLKIYVDAKMPFETASVEANIMIAQKGGKSTAVNSYVYNPLNSSFDYLCSVDNKYIEKMPFKIFPFVYKEEILNLLLKIQSSKYSTLSNFVNITRGFECGYNDESIVNHETKYRLIKAESISKYHIDDSRIIYCQPDFDNGSKYKTKEVFTTVPKLITKFVASEICFAIDNTGYYNTNSIYNVILYNDNLKIEYLLAILNSKICTFWFNTTYLNDDDLFPHIQKNQLDAIPIPDILIEKQKPFINLVDKILDITKTKDYITNTEKQTEVKKLEHQIDELVYELYDIGLEEIEIVENSIKK